MTTQDVNVHSMPVTAHIARFILTLQLGVGFGVIALGIFASIGSGFTGPYLLLLLASATGTALLWLLVARWPSRKKSVRWGAIAIQAASFALLLALPLLDGGIDSYSRLIGSVVPVATIILLAVPSTGRWFDR
ncbi:hypothetical protein [Nonomuraea rubra]|uniref:hypothetical protein n=1 Tax=Nonomuraea rubra TaxID=46180 RepID=UPI0033DABE58